ncbi:MAG TPA: DNA-binding transcriptional regulator, partial [Humisphaera sp.]|nr:DNA-binding transcriptional regulator [Humisphaera sp.]
YLSEHGRGDSVPAWLSGWKGNGIIARIENRRIARAVQECGLPTVDMSSARLLPKLPWVSTDNEAIARLALNHLRERGFRHVGYCGLSDFQWSVWRAEHFKRLAEEAGCGCQIHMARRRGDRAAAWAIEQRELAAWVRSLPKPAGVFSCYDIRGRQILEACRSANLRVPDDVAVIGVDNDLVLCELAEPPLSSVIPDTRRTGYLAAQLLERMMSGRAVKPLVHLVEPLGIATRQSTDVLAIEDQEVSAAVQFIRNHACEGITVDRVLDAVPVSRRMLERRFRRIVGRTPHEEIVRVQVERASQMLRGTDLPLKTIAERIGLRHGEYLSVLFKRATGIALGAFRRGLPAREEQARGNGHRQRPNSSNAKPIIG